MKQEPSRLDASRERLKATLNHTTRQLERELGFRTAARFLVPLLAASAGLALALGLRRRLKAPRRTAIGASGEEGREKARMDLF